MRAGNAAVEREPRNRRLLGGARDLDVRHGRAGAQACTGFDLDRVEAASQADHHARHAGVAHDQVGAEPDDGDGNLRGEMRQEIREIALVLRHEQQLRRAADAKPGQLRQRLVGEQPPAQFGHLALQLRNEISKHQPITYAAAPASSPGSA